MAQQLRVHIEKKRWPLVVGRGAGDITLPLSYKLPVSLPCPETGSPVARLASTTQTVDDDHQLPILLFQLSRCRVQPCAIMLATYKIIYFCRLRN